MTVRLPPTRAQLALLQHPQELHLHRQRHVADLVEEERAAVRLLETPQARLLRAGERAALVAEELDFRAPPPRSAAQFTRMKGRSARRLRRWTSRATSSLPVPLSPRIITVESVGATRLSSALIGASPSFETDEPGRLQLAELVPAARLAPPPHAPGRNGA